MSADLIEVAFSLGSGRLAQEHRFALAEALERALPWLAQEPEAGVHRLKLVAGGGGEAIVSRRTRLVLRVPRARAEAAAALAGRPLQVGAHALQPADPRTRELLPYGTLYAPLVASGDDDEGAFLARVGSELAALEVRAQPVCGRWQSLERGRLVGCSLMLSGLDREQSLRVLRHGLGAHRRLGCGLFVPHKSAAAVGMPD
jgi:CRISPR-associated protein Cas6